MQEGEHGPALRFMSRRNPHNPGGGEMRLYLRLQVEVRALKVWGSEVRYGTPHHFFLVPEQYFVCGIIFLTLDLNTAGLEFFILVSII